MRSLLLVISLFLVFSACDNKEVIYTSSNYSIEERVEDLLSRMTLEEKVSQMRMFHANLGVKLDAEGNLNLSENVKGRLIYGVGGVKNPGEHLSPVEAAQLNNQFQKYIIENNRLGIPAFFVTESYNGVDAEGCTRYGRPLTLSCSYNLDLVKRVYDQMGREARLRGLHLTHSPEADIVRDPRFGRMSETFGEDTYLTTEMIVNAIKGLQGDYVGLKSTHIGAVTKHFAGYAQVSGGRNFASIEISPRTLIDEIFPPFEAAVKRASSLGIMASHGDLNGIACHANPWLLTEVLRNQWNFDGYVVSDANDIGRLHYFMKVAETPEEAVLLGLKASVDLDLYADDAYALLPEMVEKQPELIEYIDRSVARILRTKFRLGLFDNPYVNIEETEKIVRNKEALDLAHESDLESIILLKNENQVLPLNNVKGKTLALVGPLLYPETAELFSDVLGDKVKLIQEKGFDLTDGVRSIPSVTPDEEMKEGIRKIVDKTRNADVIVAFVGGDEFTAKEAFFNGALGDRDNIKPVGLQADLITELKKTGKPVIVVLKHRRTLAINVISQKADAILDCWDLSEIGDLAIAKMLIGSVVPSGKLAVTVPRSIGQMPFHYSTKEIDFKKGYLFTESTPLYPFGFGLSYSKFEYSNFHLSDSVLKPDGEITAYLTVKNTGTVKAKEITQFYIKDLYGSVVRPNMELKYFEKNEINPGESKTIAFKITPDILKFSRLDMKRLPEPGDFNVMAGANSADLLTKSFKLLE